MFKKNFILYIIGSSVSLIGDLFNNIAFVWVIYMLTQKVSGIGNIWAIQGLFLVLMNPFIGAYVDKKNAHHLFILFNILNGFLMLIGPFLLLLTKLIQIWHFYFIVILDSIFSIFISRCSFKIIIFILDKEKLIKGNAILTTGYTVLNILIPAVAGFLLSIMEYKWFFLIDAFSFFFSAAIFSALKINDIKKEKKRGNFRRLGNDIKNGFLIVLKEPFIKWILVFSLSINFFAPLYIIGFPVISERFLKMGAMGYGIINSCLSLGFTLSGIFLTKINIKKPLNFMLFSLLMLSIVTLFFIVKNPFIIFVSTFLTGILIGNSSIISNSLTQKNVPPQHLGKISGLIASFSNGFQPLGYFYFSRMFDYFSPLVSFASGSLGIFSLSLVSYFYLKSKHLLKIKTEET